MIRRLLWLGLLGFLGLYLYGLVMGVFSPGELIGFTAIAAFAAIAFSVHATRVHRALEDPRHPQHESLMRGTQGERERRGF